MQEVNEQSCCEWVFFIYFVEMVFAALVPEKEAWCEWSSNVLDAEEQK